MAESTQLAPNKSLPWIIIAVVVLLRLGTLAYFSVGYVVFNTLTAVHPECQRVCMAGRRDFTPANFEGVYDSPKINLDVSPDWMESYQTVEFPTREDGVRISAWFGEASAPSNYAVIVVHGGDVCRRNTSALLPAGMLANLGFNGLLIDLCNHGDSDMVGKGSCAGVTEYRAGRFRLAALTGL